MYPALSRYDCHLYQLFINVVLRCLRTEKNSISCCCSWRGSFFVVVLSTATPPTCQIRIAEFCESIFLFLAQLFVRVTINVYVYLTIHFTRILVGKFAHFIAVMMMVMMMIIASYGVFTSYKYVHLYAVVSPFNIRERKNLEKETIGAQQDIPERANCFANDAINLVVVLAFNYYQFMSRTVVY